MRVQEHVRRCGYTKRESLTVSRGTHLDQREPLLAQLKRPQLSLKHTIHHVNAQILRPDTLDVYITEYIHPVILKSQLVGNDGCNKS
jgi:ribosomal protein L18